MHLRILLWLVLTFTPGCPVISYITVERLPGTTPCVSSSVPWTLKKPARVVILPPQRADDPMERCYEKIEPDAEHILQQILETHLAGIAEIRLVAQDRLEELLPQNITDEEALRLARFHRADYVLSSRLEKCARLVQPVTTRYGDIRYHVAEAAFTLSLIEARSGRIVFTASHSGDGRQLLSKDRVRFEVDPVNNAIYENAEAEKERIEDEEALLKKLVAEVMAEFPRPVILPPADQTEACIVYFSGLTGDLEAKIKEIIWDLYGQIEIPLDPAQTEDSLSYQIICHEVPVRQLYENLETACHDRGVQVRLQNFSDHIAIFKAPIPFGKPRIEGTIALAVLDFHEKPGIPPALGADLAAGLIVALKKQQGVYNLVERTNLQPVIREALFSGRFNDGDIAALAHSDHLLIGEVAIDEGTFTLYYRIIDEEGNIVKACRVRANEREELLRAAVKSLFEEESFPHLFVQSGRLPDEDMESLTDLLLVLEERNRIKIFSLEKNEGFLNVHLLLLEGNIGNLLRDIEGSLPDMVCQPIGERHLYIFVR